jgi:hypothetical protein
MRQPRLGQFNRSLGLPAWPGSCSSTKGRQLSLRCHELLTGIRQSAASVHYRITDIVRKIVYRASGGYTAVHPERPCLGYLRRPPDATAWQKFFVPDRFGHGRKTEDGRPTQAQGRRASHAQIAARSVPATGLRIEPRVSIRYTPCRRACEPLSHLDCVETGSACGRRRRVCDPPTSSASAGPVAVNPSLPIDLCFRAARGPILYSDVSLSLRIGAPADAPSSFSASPAKSQSFGSRRCDGRAFISARNITWRRPGEFFSH